MKKTVLLLITSLFLISSCKFAHGLNNFLGLKAPEDRNFLTVFSDLDSKDYMLVDLGDNFQWDGTKITLGQLLKDEKFSTWFNGLKNENWNKVGIYAPETDRGLLTEDIEFTVSKNEAFYVGWDSPFEKIRIRANNFSNQYFEYYLQYRYAYDKEIELNFNDVCKDDYFNKWLSDLDSSVDVGSDNYVPYSPVGFTDQIATSSNYYSLENKKSVLINKWKVYINIGWIPDTLLTGFTVFANDGSEYESSRYFPLDDEYESFDVSWNYLVSSDDGFLAWYNGLSKPGYGKIGLSTQRNGNWDFLSSESYSVMDTISVQGTNNKLYVIWEPEIPYVEIKANNGTEDSFLFYPPVSSSRLRLTWNMLERNDAFMDWYKGLSDHSRGIYTLGLSFESDSSKDNSINIYQYNSSYYCDISSNNTILNVVYGSYLEDISLWIDFEGIPSFTSGESYQACYSVSRESAPSVKSIEFSSDNSLVASVDSHGLVSALSEGSACITFKAISYNERSFTSTYRITVNKDSVFKKISEFNGFVSDYGVSADGTKQVIASGNSILYSTDSGKIWTSKIINDSGYISRISMSPSGEIVTAVFQKYEDNDRFEIGLIKDGGKTYSTVYSVSGKYYSLGQMAVSDDGKVIAFSHSETNIYVSNDGGTTWKLYSVSGGNGLAVSASGKNVAYASSGKIYYSSDYGNNFSEIILSSGSARIEELRMSADGKVILSLVNDGDDPEIYKIVDGSQAGTITPAGRGSIYNMYVSSDCKGIIYRDYGNNLYYSTDQGMFWNTIPERMAIWPDLYITENMKEVYFHYSYYSFNGKVAIYRWKRY